jgi:P4 family phage/plasmid primase-like protien
MSQIKVCNGLFADATNQSMVSSYDSIEKVELECKTKKNLYLVYTDDEEHKIFLDIDLKKKNYKKEWDFEFLKQDILNEIKKMLNMNKISIAESHKDDKISYRVIINDFKMKISEMKEYVKDIYKPEFPYDCIDLQVYRNGVNKMRLPHSSKDGEDRPLKIIKGQFSDFLTCITKNCEYRTYKKKEIIKEVQKIETNDTNDDDEEKINSLLVLLNKNRGDNFDEWFKIGTALKEINEDNDLLFNEFSKTRQNYKDLKDVRKHWRTFPKSVNGIGQLINLAKEDNNEGLKIWQKKYIKIKKEIKFENDFWDMMQNINHSDFAKLYNKLTPTKYITTKSKDGFMWFEYNEFNILVNQYGTPSSLTNNIADTLQQYITQKRNEVLPPSKPSTAEQDKAYDEKMKLFKKAYQNLGTSSYIKGIIDFLGHLYIKTDLLNIIDSNVNLLAFNDKVYDISLKAFRNIEPTDYITMTTKMNAPIHENIDVMNNIKTMLSDIFGKQENIDYWLITTALALFGNRNEKFFVLNGKGGNGKGLLSTILNKILGNYIYNAESTFLSSVLKDNSPNPTLANLKGIRYLLVSEPDNGSNESKFNTEFIKKLTGRDLITARDLHKSNITYIPQFTPFCQCNTKPKLSKIDDGIIRRLRIQHFPFNFIENYNKATAKPHEKPADTKLKDNMNDDFYNNFMLLLLNTAKDHIDKNSIIEPPDVVEQTNEYIDTNNIVKEFMELRTRPATTEDKKNKIKLSELFADYCSLKLEYMTKEKFISDLKFNNFVLKKVGDLYVLNTVYKEIPKEEENAFVED